MINQKEILENIDEKTLLDLIQQSFSVNGLSVEEAKELALAMLLEKKLTEIPSIKSNDSFKVYFTHDIDWIYPHHIYSIIKTLLPNKKWLTVSQLFQPTIYLKNIEKLIAFEAKKNVKSIFNVGANDSCFSLGRFDIRYTIHNPYYKKLIEILKLHQVEIGLHSEVNFDLNEQIESIKRLSGQKIKFHRSHFFNSNRILHSKILNDKNIEIDLSIGNAREVGFKTGIPRHYHAIDFINKKVLKTKIVPTILSDNAFFFHDKNSVFGQFKNSIKTAKQFGASVAILFHPENIIIKPELWEYYDEIIDICQKELK